MEGIRDYEPKSLWHYFTKILEIPRPSDHEEQIRDYLIRFARERDLPCLVDQAGNVLIRKKATAGFESGTPVCLQSHLDMVCEKNSSVQFDFLKDPIRGYIEDGWIKAAGTTLGADDGIGIAAQLAVLDSGLVEHGPLECLFTVAEETGLHGAFGLQSGFLQSRILINLDSEDEGELFIGCAGGIDLTATIPVTREAVPSGYSGIHLMISGLKGGHSGDDIHRGLGNANKLLTRFLWEQSKNGEIRINHLQGGNLRNAIAREAEAVIAVPVSSEHAVREAFEIYSAVVRNELCRTEPGLKCSFRTVTVPGNMFEPAVQRDVLDALYGCPHGVISWSQVIPGLVESSTNLASIRTEDDQVRVATSQRSSVESAKMDISQMVESVFRLANAAIQRSTGYPGWNPNPDSPILSITRQAYTGLFNVEPTVRAIHAGLECGLFLTKYPDLDMVSFGPTIKGVHSPDERLEIVSVSRFWDLLVEVLKRIP